MSQQIKDPLNQVKSLAGKVQKQAMGLKNVKSKPKKKLKKKAVESEERVSFRGGDILSEKFTEATYRPKTKENRLTYEKYVGKIYALVEDQPPEILQSIVQEVLAIVMGDADKAIKKTTAEAIIGQKINQETFIDICNIVQALTDYKIQQQQQPDNEAVAMQQQQQSQVDSQEVIEQQQIEVEEEPLKDLIEVHQQVNDNKVQNNNHSIDASDIDAHWLHSELTKYYDPTQAQQVQKSIMRVLNAKTKLQTQSLLLQMLNYEKYELIHLLLNNRMTIYYCTRYHQSNNEKQKQQLAQQMKGYNIQIGRKVKRQDHRKVAVGIHKRQKMEVEQDNQTHFEQVKDEQISKINKKIIELTLHEAVDRTSNKQQYKFKLPQGASKIAKPGYEQVHIPASSKNISPELVQLSTIPEWMQSAFKGVKRFNPIQSQVINYALNSTGNMLICAPTSAGKTNIALMAILQTISHYRNDSFIDTGKFKIVYIAPMKALVSEVTGNLENKLSHLGIKVKQLTGDIHLSKGQIEDTQIIVSTPEKWDIITRKAGDRLFTQQVKLLIIDQIHLLSDSRGPVLESIIARTIRQIQNSEQITRIVGLSATLPNYKDVGVTLRVKPKQGLFYFDQSYRPIPLDQLFIGITQKKGVRKMLMINQILYQKVMQRVLNQQMIIFVHSRRDTVRTARAIYETALGMNEVNRIIRPDSESKKILDAITEKQTINSNDLKELLVAGIGIHHAGLSRGDRDLVQQLFADRHFNILISTATLAWGVNLPAHTVIIKGTQVYSSEQGRWVDLSLQDVMQMMGRAGRPMYDQQGQGIILTGYEEIRYYLGLLNMQIALQSQLMRTLPDQLNAEVVLGTVCNLKDAVNWLSYSYLYVRMLKNPTHYQIPIEEIEQDPELLKRRVNLAHTAACILQKNGLVFYDRKNGGITTTFLGKIASYYYIKYPSMAIYNNNLKNSSGLIEILKIFSMSIEFKYLSVRDQEKNQLKKLNQSVPVPIKGTIDDSTTKISALLQAHISKLQLDGYALNADKIYVTQSASRIIRALFEICLKRGWGQAAQCCLQLAKMVDKCMWNCLNPLRQFKQIPQYVLNKLQKKQQFSWQSFYQMSPQQIGDLTKFQKLGKILHKFVHNVPRVNIDAYAQPLTRSCLRVDLTVKVDFKWQDEFHGKQQPFWLLVLDCNEQNILFSYYFTLTKKQTEFCIQFIVPLFEVLHPLYFVKVLSDRWICTDNTLPLSFRNMLLPSKFQQATQLLDLQSIPANSLSPLAKQLRITHLNQIQTQVYSAFLSWQHNIFLGANEGSGKFTMALFAIQKCLQLCKKVIVMVSQRSLAKLKLLHLTKIFHKKKVAMLYEDLTKDIHILAQMDIIICTPSAFDILSRRYKARKGFVQIGLIVVDNLHLMNQNKSTMEVVISRIRYITSQSQQYAFRLICLSSSIADYKQVSEWIGATPQTTFNFHPSIRTNSLGIIFNTYDQIIRQSRLHMMQKHIMQHIKYYNRNAIVVVNDKKQTKLTALDFISLLSHTTNPKKMRKISDQQMRLFSKKITDQFLVHVLEYGIGYLYEGMSQMEHEIVEQLFQIQGIKILVISQQLKWQIQLKAFTVAILDCIYFDCATQQWRDYSIGEMVQFMSMSAISEKDKHRGKQYSSSKFMVMCMTAKKTFYKKFLFEPYPIQSALHLHLSNHLNSSIVAKTIQNKQDCIDWLTWTFFYRRLSANPNYYNLQQVSQQTISSYLSELIENTVQNLECIKCLQVENQMDLSATNLGIVCSYYYISVDNLNRFVDYITEGVKLKTILQLVCSAQELEMFGYYPNQQPIIAEMLLPLNEKAINKVHALLLLHLGRINIPSNLKYLLRQTLPICVRLIHALVDIISSFGFLKPLILAMQLCQMIVQAMWVNDCPLLQVMNQNLATHLQENYHIKDINDFLNMDQQTRTNALKGRDVTKIANACNRYPIMNITNEIISQDAEQISIKVTLQRDEALQKDTVICPYYPVEKQEYWWIVIGDKKINRVLTTKRTLLKQSVSLDLQFEPTETHQYTIYALCDSYIGCDQIDEINFQQ